ncbi:MAG: metal ABC transporter substrate-binding protein, partial [Dinoroseobacter sp.]|nr:metal ABC transporter substrate-binding protein [Dinoroseobacter sp.]
MPELTLQSVMRRLIVASSVLLFSAHAPVKAQDRPTVVAVNYALSYFAERLGGSDIEVVFPVPDGVDPSFWRPGISDISTMQNADLILLNGAGFATWTAKASLPRSRILDTSRGFEDRFITTETVTHSHGEGGEHSHTGTASFTWLDQELAILQAAAIAEALAQRGLAEPATVETRMAALTEDLTALDAAAERLRPLAEGKVLIATHPRYQYLARAYDLDIRSLDWEAGAAPDKDQLADLEALVKDSGALVLLWEAQPTDEARAAIRELGLADVVFPTLA